MNRREAIQRTSLLLGYAVSAPALMGLFQGCKAAPELTYTPSFFTKEQAETVSELAELIIPKTDTPGAKETGVPAFIDAILKECYSAEDQQRFLTGLAEFEADAQKTYGDTFVYLKPEQQTEVYKKFHDPAAAEAKKSPSNPKPFALMLKELTLLGFFTSEPGATQVLQYEAVPGRYHGCVPLAEVGRTWAS
jgi:gluconate 2-dehydrogenase gamma chain